MNYLFQNETLEDLQLDGLRLIQTSDGFRFGEDSVILANYTADFLLKRKKPLTIFDLGCNSGVLSFIIASKIQNSLITGVEISKKVADLFARNIKLNKLEKRIKIINCDWTNIREYVTGDSANVVISNPPYFRFNESEKLHTDSKKFARHEDNSGIAKLAKATEYLLKPGGISFYIYRSDRLSDVIQELRNANLEPIKIRFIHSFQDRAPKSFIIVSRKGGKPGGFQVEKPLVIFSEQGKYTQEVSNMYGKEQLMKKEDLLKDIVIENERN